MMTKTNETILIIGLLAIFLFIVGSVAFISEQPNDLICDRMISIDDGQELLLLGCENIRTEGFGDYTIRVIFDR